MSNSPMQALYSQLSLIDIKPAFARRVLPTWWDDSIAATDAGIQQAQLYIAKAFNLDICSFDTAQIQFRQVQRNFKLSSNVTEASVNVSAHYATGIARLALQAVGKQHPVPAAPLALRNTCLQSSNAVDLNALLTWCASANIPVLHVDLLPGKKMTGLVVREDGQFAIVLSRKGCQSEMLFWLAHELGHIACGHLNSDGFFADVKIGENAGDELEKQADAYAVSLINGSAIKYKVTQRLPAPALAQAAISKGQGTRVDAGHILLNFGHHNPAYISLSKAALKALGQNSVDATRSVNASLFRSLSPESLSEDQLDLLHKACGFNPHLSTTH